MDAIKTPPFARIKNAGSESTSKKIKIEKEENVRVEEIVSEENIPETKIENKEKFNYSDDFVGDVLFLAAENKPSEIAKKLNVEVKYVNSVINKAKKMIREKAIDETEGGIGSAYAIKKNRKGEDAPDFNLPISELAKEAEMKIKTSLMPPKKSRDVGKSVTSILKNNNQMKKLIELNKLEEPSI